MKRLLSCVCFMALAVSLVPVSAETVPFPLDWPAAGGSTIDLSGWLDAPAGKHGFIRERDGHLATEDGRRFRIWGVNVCGPDCFPTREEAVAQATLLARLGFNAVRFHHMDSTWSVLFDKTRGDTRELSADALERLDFFIAELKKRGIYANINLNVGREFRAGDGVRDHQALGYGKSATYFNPRLIELQHEFARQLLMHSNRHTGFAYRHDPAVIAIEIVNENSVLEGWQGWRLVGKDEPKPHTWSPIPVSYANELTDLYNAWLAKNRPAEFIAKLRREAGVGDNDPVPRLAPNQFAAASADRFHAEAEFLIGLERGFFEGMRRLLKDELGVKPMVIGCADHSDGYAAYAHIASLAMFDGIDGHGYWQHPDIGAVTKCRNTPMVNDPLDSTYTQFARTPVRGRPFTISEVNHPYPHDFACEGFPILTAYALFSDWDGIYWFTWGRGPGATESGIRPYGWFDLSADPVKIANLIACGLLWHRRDVQTARQTIVRSYSREQMIEGLRLDRNKERPFFTPGFARSTPLQHKTVFTLDGSPATPFPAPAPPDEIMTDTGEIGWFDAGMKKGVVTLDTPRSQALIGHVRASGRKTKHLAASVSNGFCSLVLTSLDGEPIASSRRLLLAATAWCGNTDMQWEGDKRHVLNGWGRGPVLIEPVAGDVNVSGLGKAGAVRVHPLSPLGVKSPATWPATLVDGSCRIAMGRPAATLALIEVDR